MSANDARSQSALGKRRPGTTTPARPVEAESVLPELAAHRRTTTRLHPRPGAPTALESSIGGPLLWPGDEPWPTCVTEFFAWDVSGPARRDWQHPAPNPMVPVLQLFSRDATTITYPAGTDLLQLLWCPCIHPELPGSKQAFAPSYALIWRDSNSLSEAARPAPPRDADPTPCTVHPEVLTEYSSELPPELRDRTGELDEEGWGDSRGVLYQYDLSVAQGSKVGGWARWHAVDPHHPPCPDCATPLEMLINLDSIEHQGGGSSWDPAGADCPYDPTGMTLGRGGDLQIFTCPANPRHRSMILVQG